MSDPLTGVVPQAEKKPLGPTQRMAANTDTWNSFYVSRLHSKVAPGTFESHKAFLSMR
jgi:hypothetical protein